MTKVPCVYIMASKRNGTIYVGVTSNIVRRVWQHKNNLHRHSGAGRNPEA